MGKGAMMNPFSFIWRLLFPPELDILTSIASGRMNSVSNALARKPELDRELYYVFNSYLRRFYSANETEIESYKAGQRKAKRNNWEGRLVYYHPTDFSESCWRPINPQFADNILHALKSYGFPPPHQCSFTVPRNESRCEFACGTCRKTKFVHDDNNICCERGPKFCQRCGTLLYFERAKKSVVKRTGATYNTPPLTVESCKACGALLRHSDLKNLHPQKVCNLRYINEKDCTMIDPATGETFHGIHQEFIESSDYDCDYNRTTYSLECTRCGTHVEFPNS
jgi:hypothetical protein